ncbi:uncharacterized protein LOC103723949 [Phoenix dactylifera]|uniref:Uncharacterized protein LOC103723949 n=1 Tax=Phoenix dactylifera TaxID=42345 RepID=A0A8B7D5F6_PHODC|nr:uncharacterized protein LOC103723949 [Phoenix dactylifera]
MHISPECPDCSRMEESIFHVILGCPRVAQIWGCASSLLAPWQGWLTTEAIMLFLETSSRRSEVEGPRIMATYLAYHSWLDRNARIFENKIMHPLMVADRALLQAMKVTCAATLSPLKMTGKIWGSPPPLVVPKIVLVSLEPPPSDFLKVNFDGSVGEGGSTRGVGFVIRDHEARLIAVEDQRIFDTSVLGVEIRAAWEGVTYARRVLGADYILLEGDSAMVIEGFRGRGRDVGFRPLLCNIRRLLAECGLYGNTYVYNEANNAADWVASFATHHAGGFIWVVRTVMPHALGYLLSSNLDSCSHARHG